MKLLVAGGGTGGHIFPGLSVARRFKQQFPGAAVCFIGSNKPIDREVVRQAGFDFVPLPQIPAPQSVFSLESLRFPANSVRSFARAWREVRRFRPDAVLGLGGYSSVAPVLAARLLRVPALLFEANLRPGKANLFLSRFVKTVAVGFGVDRGYFTRNRVVVTGIPVREPLLLAAKIEKANAQKESKGFTLLVMGGSSGARALNRITAEAVPRLKEKVLGLRLIHLTGKQEFPEMEERYRKLGTNGLVELHPFLMEMESVLLRADAVVARSGASSLAEFALFGIPALLVPYPHSSEAHQVRNAEFFAERGAAKMILEQDLTPEKLVETVAQWAGAGGELQLRRAAALELGQADATNKLTELLIKIAHSRCHSERSEESSMGDPSLRSG